MHKGGLRRRVIDGAMHLALRQGFGTVISLVGLLMLTRAIGPEAYGTYAAFVGVFRFTTSVTRMGIDVYLIRRTGNDRSDLDQGFTMLALTGVAVGIGGWLALPLIGDWLGLDNARSIGLAFAVALPLHMATFVPRARLERNLEYRAVAWLELGGQVAYYLVALPLAYLGWGVAAPIAGWMMTQLLNSGLMFFVSKYWPRLRWDLQQLRTMLGYGLAYSASQWIWQIRDLVNPMIVGRFAGLEVVGYVALAFRLVNTLSFVKNATYRLSISSFAQIQEDLPKLRRVLSEGIRLQVLVLGPALLAFQAVAPWVLPRLFGQDWLPLLAVFPFIAVGGLFNSAFALQASVLYVLRHNLQVAIFHVVHVGLFAGSAFLLVPRYGATGYGLAELVTLVSYLVISHFTIRAVGTSGDVLPMVWTVAFSVALFYPFLGPAALLALLPALLWRESWRAVRGYAIDLRRLVHG